MKIFQVVFLLDLDSIFQTSRDEGTLAVKTKTLREVVLKFLTLFATEHCTSDHNASFRLKWDCKYYISSVNKTVRQRCIFKDFNLENYEKFENELDDKLKKRRLEQEEQHRQSTSSVENGVIYNLDCDHQPSQSDKLWSKQASPCQGDKKPSFKTRLHNLELALKNLVCDYTWDQPYVCSPIRKTRRQQKNGEFKRKDFENDADGDVENIVIVITSVPSLLSQLDGLAEGKRRLTHNVLLDKILPPSLYKQFVQISKIRLFWLDTADTVLGESDNDIGLSEARAIFDLFHQALRKTGGGLIPLNAILPTQHTDNNEPSTKNKYIPEELVFQIPAVALMSGYLSGGSADTKAQSRSCSRLHLNLGTEESRPVMCDLELLPLFRSNIGYSKNSVLSGEKCESLRISCANEAVEEKSASNVKITVPVKHFTVTCPALKEEPDLYYIPRDICIIGSVLLCEIHRQLIAKPLVYICCSMDHRTAKNQSSIDSLSLQQILSELASKQMALLVSCDDLSQGIFFPLNSRCEIALLYILVSEGEASVFTQKVEPASIPKDINSFIQKSLATHMNFSPQKRKNSETNSKHGDAVLPTAFLEKWFIPHPFHKRTLSKIKAASPPIKLQLAQKTIFRSLQKAYLPSLMNTKLKEYSSDSQGAISNHDRLRCSPRLKRDSQLKAISPKSEVVPRYSSIQKRISVSINDESNYTHSKCSRPSLTKRTSILSDEMSTAGICAQADENTMLTSLTMIYKNAISGDSTVISIAQTVLDVCITFYKNQDRINAKMCTRDAISKHFLLKPGDVESSNDTKEVAKKWKIREHCFQSIIRMELLAIDPSNTKEYVTEILSHLRKLSFIAGPSTLSSFLHETLVESYYSQLKEPVTEICEDLNQPLPDENAKFSPSSSNNDLLSPEKPESIPTSVISQMSVTSSISSSSNQLKQFKSKRSEAVIRHPSFGDVAHKRKIVISQRNLKRHSLLKASNTGPLTRSAQERLTGSKSESRNVCRTLFKHGIPTTKKHTTPLKPQKPTTPKGRHVLRTKNAADTPVHKQVDHPTLRRQSLKRKWTFEFDSQENEVVEESPDKQPDPSFKPRRSPKRHANTLRREASFYSNCPESKTEQAIACNVASSKTPLRRSTRKVVQIACQKITPDKKLKAKRVLILSDTPEKAMNKTTPKKAFKGNSSPFGPRRSDRLAGMEESPNHKRTPTRSVNSCLPRSCGKQDSKRTPTGSSRKSPRLSKSFALDFKESTINEIDISMQHPLAKCKAREMPKNPTVSRKLLQTPLKSEFKPASQTPTTMTSTSSIYDEDRVPSTPTRIGLESPKASPTHVFLYGPLAENLDDCLSRSSSPIIPLLSCDMTEFYEDQNQCASLETSFDATSFEKCDDFHAGLDTEVNFSQYFTTNDTQTNLGVIQDATVPSEKLAQENTNFMYTPIKTYQTDVGSPECALPLWETQNGFNGAFGRLAKHTRNFQDREKGKAGSHETIQFSSAETINAFEKSCSSVYDNFFNPKPSAASEENAHKTKLSSSFSDSYGLQRFTRQSSKELGISLKEFKKLSCEFGLSEIGEKVCKTAERKWNSGTNLSNAPKTNPSPSPSKFSRQITKPKFTSPTDKSIFHLTNSPILSPVSTRTTRYSLKKANAD